MTKSKFPRRLLVPAPERILSKEQCEALAHKLESMSEGGGNTQLTVDSHYVANVRWANNAIFTGGNTQNTVVTVVRNINGALAGAETNALDDETLRVTVERAERKTLLKEENPTLYPMRYEPQRPWDVHPISKPALWFDDTYNLDAKARADIIAPLMAKAAERGLQSAGYFEIDAQGASVVAYAANLVRYYTRTMVQFSVTVHDFARNGSGWAGVDFNDWTRIDAPALVEIAIDKCERSRNPVAVEPGYYTTILEPQAVSDLVAPLFSGGGAMARASAEAFHMGPFVHHQTDNSLMMEERVIDERLSIIADPVDPDCGFLPFDWSGEPYLPTEWIEKGILKNMSYDRWYGLLMLAKDQALPDSLSFRIKWDGPTTTMEEMIATTKRGILVTRFSAVQVVDWDSAQFSGNTRDGLWLIERGKITKSLKNFRFLESAIGILNRVQQVGVAQRTFRPGKPAFCPSMKVWDFNFNGVVDAV